MRLGLWSAREKRLVYIYLLVFYGICLQACDPPPEPVKLYRKRDYIRAIPGKSDSIPAEYIDRGKVLVAYADCYTCHTDSHKFKGPAFSDIAKRYPVNDGYIELLARKIILGGSGAWGYPVMSPHPDLSLEDAKMMVRYILSLKK